jgi:hypothetical protein
VRVMVAERNWKRGATVYFHIFYILIHYVYMSVSQWRGFWGVGEGEADEAVGDGVSLWRGLDHHGFRVQTVSTKHCSRPKGRNDGRIASHSHRTITGYKNLPPPPPPPPLSKEPMVI